jgi:protein ImuA
MFLMSLPKSIQIARLQQQINRMTVNGQAAAYSLSDHDAPAERHSRTHLPERLAPGCIHEVEGASWDAETGVGPAAFAAAMLSRIEQGAILWAVRQDAPFAPRLAAFGLDPDRVIFCRCANDSETLAALEDGLRTKGIAAAVGEVAQVTLTQSRRLHLICEASKATGLLLRRHFHGATRARKPQASAATSRWRIGFAPTEPAAPGLGTPRWRLDLLYCRGGMPASFLVEWNDETHHLRLVAKLADHETLPDDAGLRRTG